MGAVTDEEKDPRGASIAPRHGSETGESLGDVLSSIRKLVSAETAARLHDGSDGDGVLVLTGDLRVDTDPGESEDGLAAGLGNPDAGLLAPSLDEEGLRSLINSIVREELQGELGARIERNLRRLVRREVSLALQERDREA